VIYGLLASLGLGIGGVAYFAIKAYSAARDLVDATGDAGRQAGRADLAEARLAASSATIAAQQAALDKAAKDLQELEALYATTYENTQPDAGSRPRFVQALKQLSTSLAANSRPAKGGVSDAGPAAPGPNGLIDPFVQR
jgi:hypothetical protein